MASTSSYVYCTTALSPPVHRGMAVLDRKLFEVEMKVMAARIPAALTTQFARKQASQYLLRLPRKMTTIMADPTSSEHRLVLLGLVESDPLPQDLADVMSKANIPPLINHSILLDYDYWTAEQIIRAVLPEELLGESPSAFTQVGHIAHLNLRDEYLPYKNIIGQIILDKNNSVRTVVNKLDTIDNEFRNFKMEVLAGDNDFLVETFESNCHFHFDFSLVYWNSRLQGEHGRLVDTFSPNDVIVDAFAGVGPFAIPAGKKGCGVLASDLNPASASALKENARINKVEGNVRTSNEDARVFIRQSVLDIWNSPFPAYEVPVSAKALSKQRRAAAAVAARGSTAILSSMNLDLLSLDPSSSNSLPARRLANHFVMNLPGLAIEFLDAYKGLYSELYKLEGAREAVEKSGELPLIHCYCFTKDMEDQEGDILARATKALGLPVTKDLKDYALKFVRDVAPKKEMYCLEFRLSPGMVE